MSRGAETPNITATTDASNWRGYSWPHYWLGSDIEPEVAF